MTTTPKSVILAVVLFLGAIVLAVIAAEVALVITENGDLPDTFIVLGSTALGALGGVLASTRTAPELAPGAVLETGATTLSGGAYGTTGKLTRKETQALIAQQKQAPVATYTTTIPNAAPGTTYSVVGTSATPVAPEMHNTYMAHPDETGDEFAVIDPASLGYEGGTVGGTNETEI